MPYRAIRKALIDKEEGAIVPVRVTEPIVRIPEIYRFHVKHLP